MSDAFAWDDVLPGSMDEDSFTLLEPGEYWAQVQRWEQDHYVGNGKDCGKAVVIIKARDDEGNQCLMWEHLLMHKSMGWKLRAFFKAMGLAESGKDFKMRWDKIKGRALRVKVKVDHYNPEKPRNKVEQFLPWDNNLEAPEWAMEPPKEFRPKDDPPYVIQREELPAADEEIPF